MYNFEILKLKKKLLIDYITNKIILLFNLFLLQLEYYCTIYLYILKPFSSIEIQSSINLKKNNLIVKYFTNLHLKLGN